MSNRNIAHWRQLSAASQVLVINGFAFNVGFYMVLPFLADHLQSSIGLSGWLIGLILGARVFSQQGMFLVGGTIGDYWGFKKTILLGCTLRIVGFVLLGLTETVTWLLIGAILTGLAGALFTPSSQAFLASEHKTQSKREEVFALQNLASEAGMLLGPLIGLALLNIDFSIVATVASGIFSLLFFIQRRFLPNCDTATKSSSFIAKWTTMIRHKSFVVFIMWASIYQILFHQLYLAIPSTARTLTHNADLITWVFMVSSIIGVFLQIPVSNLVKRRLNSSTALMIGMISMGTAYLPLILVSTENAYIVFTLTATLLSLGSLFAFPIMGAMIPKYSESNDLATRYGLYACVGGVAAFLSNIVIGFFIVDGISPPNSIWLTLALLGVISGIALFFCTRQNSD